MNTPLVVSRVPRRMSHPTLRMITATALIINALFFVPDLFTGGPYDLSLGHIIPELIVAGLIATRLRWTPALGALFGALLLVDGFAFLTPLLTHPDTAVTFVQAAMFFATAAVALVAGIAATVQHYRVPRSRPFIDPAAPRWVYPAVLALVALVLGATLATAIQPRDAGAVISSDVLAALPALKTRNDQYDQSTLTAKVGETVALRLDNADTSTHYLDIDEFNVHVLIPSGKSSVAIFKPTQPGTYTFYCHPHADKAAGTGMVGKLIVAP